MSWSTLHLQTQVLHATPSGPYPIFARASRLQGLNKSSVRFRPLPKFLSRLMLRKFLMTSAGRCHTSQTKVVTSVSLSSCRITSCHDWFNSYAISKWLLRYLAFALSATCLLPKMNMLRLQLIKACSRLSLSSSTILRKLSRRRSAGRSRTWPQVTLNRSRNASTSASWTRSSLWCRMRPLISRARLYGACQTQQQMQRPNKSRLSYRRASSRLSAQPWRARTLRL